MNLNRVIKVLVVIVCFFGLTFVIKQNVIARKDSNLIEQENISKTALKLELDSDVVDSIYNKLVLLNNDNFKDKNYRYLYFNFEDDKKLSNDEKLYVALNSLYARKSFDKTVNKDKSESLKIGASEVLSELNYLYKEADFDFTKLTYKSSINCGIVDYLYTGQNIELKYKKCNDNNIDKFKLTSARKDGNYISIFIKLAHAEVTKKDFNDDDVVYNVFNIAGDKTPILATSKKNLTEYENRIFDAKELDEYEFIFELKSEEYYLYKIKRIKGTL